MKRRLCIAICILFGAGILSGCGTKLSGDESVVYVDKKGAITTLDVDVFDQGYYSEEEFKKDMEDFVSSYNEEHGKNAVKVEDFSVEDQKVRLQMKYQTAEDYRNTIGIEMYQGKVVNALAEGYGFDVEFSAVEDGKVTGSAQKTDFYGEGDLKTVIIKANTNVKVEGEICYVSTDHVEVTGTDSVTIGADSDSLETEIYTYIVYK